MKGHLRSLADGAFAALCACLASNLPRLHTRPLDLSRIVIR